MALKAKCIRGYFKDVMLRDKPILIQMMLILVTLSVTLHANNSYVMVEVESDVEIPPLMYYDGRSYKSVHIIHLPRLEEMYWLSVNATLKIREWDLKRAILVIPKEALGKRAPPDFKRGIVRIHINKTAIVELLEASDSVVATYSYIDNDTIKPSPVKGRAEWIQKPERKGSNKRPVDTTIKSGEVSTAQLATATVYADGGFFYSPRRDSYMFANVETCLEALRVDDLTFSPSVHPTIAVLGYNATYIWRVFTFVYGSAGGLFQPVGKIIVKVYEIDPQLRWVGNKLGEWSFDVYNGIPTFSTGIPLNWPDKFVGLQICFKPSYTGVFYVVGANATVEFRKNYITYARGNYVLGHAFTTIKDAFFKDPGTYTVLIGPMALSDGYINQRITLSLSTTVKWNSPNCPTLSMDIYLGDRGQYWIGYASVTANKYSYDLYGYYLCYYDITYTRSSSIIGIWYDEARAASRGVFVKLKFNYPINSITLHRLVISGDRYAEHFVDKPSGLWGFPVLRGAYSVSRAFNSSFTNIYIRSSYVVQQADIVDFYDTSRYGLSYIKLTYRPASAVMGINVWYKDEGNLSPSEPWYKWLAREAFSIVLSILDAAGALPQGFSIVIELLTNVLQGSSAQLKYYQSGDSYIIEWNKGLNDPVRRYIGILITSNQNYERQVIIHNIDMTSDLYGDFASTLPSMSGLPWDYVPQLRHWIYGMRSTHHIPLVR